MDQTNKLAKKPKIQNTEPTSQLDFAIITNNEDETVMKSQPSPLSIEKNVAATLAFKKQLAIKDKRISYLLRMNFIFAVYNL